MMERRVGIEPTSLAWKAEALSRETNAAYERPWQCACVRGRHVLTCVQWST